jgi:methylglutaconyl-CoA hydratase
VARVVLNRPEVRNAFDDILIQELTDVFSGLSSEAAARAVVLTGEGPVFCAGADVNWMKRAAEYSREENEADALRMVRMLRTIDTCAKPVVAEIRGAAIGGGVGLTAVCDVAIAAEDAVFSLAEARLGILPAAISPFVLRAIGPRVARDYFLSGDRFGAEEARRIGLVHQVVPVGDLRAAVEKKVESLLKSGPEAVAAAKRLIETVSSMEIDEAGEITARVIAERRGSAEGREGLSAFLEKRKPKWVLP